jgi:hypothetical protein
MAARAGADCRHEGEASGIGKDGSGPGQGHEAVLQRLAQRLEGVPAELRELVEEEDAVVGEAHFPGTRDAPTADEAGVGDGVVGRAEGAAGEEGLAGGEEAGDGPELGDLTSSASRKVRGGRMVGRRLASMVLPEHGGPTSRALWSERLRTVASTSGRKTPMSYIARGLPV